MNVATWVTRGVTALYLFCCLAVCYIGIYVGGKGATRVLDFVAFAFVLAPPLVGAASSILSLRDYSTVRQERRRAMAAF